MPQKWNPSSSLILTGLPLACHRVRAEGLGNCQAPHGDRVPKHASLPCKPSPSKPSIQNSLIFCLYKYQNNKWSELWCKMEGCQYVRRLSCHKLSSMDVKKLIYWQVCYHTGAEHRVSTKCIRSKHVLAKTIIKVLPCTLGINLKPLWTPFL